MITVQTNAAVSTPTSSAMTSALSLTEQKSSGSTTLSTAQAVGISIAALGAVILAVGGFCLAAYLRRRKGSNRKNQHDSDDFVGDTPPRSSPFKHGFADSRGPHGDSARPHGELPSERHTTAWPALYTQKAFPHHQQQVREKARSMSPESLRSDCSMRTVSQLLPDRPGSTPPQPPSKSPCPPNMLTPATVFEEERSPVIPRALYPGLPAHPAAFKRSHCTHEYTRYPDQVKLPGPALSLSIPGKPYIIQEANVTTKFELLPPPPPPAITSTSNDRCDSAESNHRSSSHSLLKYYASVDSYSPEDLYSATPIEEQTQARRPPPAAITVTKLAFPPRAVRTSTTSDASRRTPRAVRTSTASDASRRTSFESTDPDEPTPPDEDDKRLTPVAESPIAAIRYPKVPRSSNQSVHRSPNHQLSPKSVEWAAARYQLHDGQISSRHSPSPSGSTLAAKRRGNTAQQDLELGLKIHDSAYAPHSRKNSQAQNIAQRVRPLPRQESPLKGYGRVANNVQRVSAWPLPDNTMEAAVRSPPLQSPLWEPKLTPRREGDDLYLSVSIATPLDAHFRR